MIKLPYGISSWNIFRAEDYYYIDRTPFIERLENLPQRYIILLRPRRFGKSLLVSMLYHYYGEQFKDQFQHYFGKYYIGKQPTKDVSTYWVLTFNFSGIDTENKATIYRDFLKNVKTGVAVFLADYPIFTKQQRQEILKEKSPQGIIQTLFQLLKEKAAGKKVYILVDEYDHFANELIAFKFNYFKEIVSKNGFVRKFYETIKNETGMAGLVNRIFMTGVSPVTLDSLTSGFNIATNISTYPNFNSAMGFTEKEVKTMYKGIGLKGQQLIQTMEDAKAWYNGYLFHPKADNKVYNPDMVLYLGSHYAATGYYPEDLLDENIASDYGKMRALARFGSEESQALKVIEEVLEKGSINAKLTKQYTFRRAMDREDFVSLMFYLGLLTVHSQHYSQWQFRIPNFVIKTLYFDYFRELLEAHEKVTLDSNKAIEAILPLAIENEIAPFIQLSEDILHQLSNRDAIKFDEKYVKTIFTALFFLSELYTIHSEFETDRKYTDLLCTYRRPVDVKYQLLFELKYIKKQDADTLATVQKEAVIQLEGYLAHDKIKRLNNLKAWLIIFVGAKAVVVENLQ